MHMRVGLMHYILPGFLSFFSYAARAGHRPDLNHTLPHIRTAPDLKMAVQNFGVPTLKRGAQKLPIFRVILRKYCHLSAKCNISGIKEDTVKQKTHLNHE